MAKRAKTANELREKKVRDDICCRIIRADSTKQRIANDAGIPASTFYSRIKHPATMTLREYWAIDEALRRHGAKSELGGI